MIALAAFLGGLGFARLSQAIGLTLVGIVAAIVLVAFFIRKQHSIIFIAALVIFAFIFGWWRGAQYMQKLTVYDDIIGRNVVMEVSASEDGVYDDKGLMTFTAGNITLHSPENEQVVGQITVAGRGVPIVYRGDKLKVEGRLYKKRGSSQAGISYATIELLSRNTSVIDNIRRKFAAGLQNSLPEPLASFGLGLLIGQRNTLGQELTDTLTAVGLIHIVAVSGYNLTIIVGASQKLFAKRSRYQAFILSLLLIGIFLLITGSSASIVRAAIVSTLSLFAWYFGRRFRPVMLLLIAAVITAGLNPLLIWSNVGWYLSFTAFFGVLVLGPLLKERFAKKDQQEKIIPSVLSETLAAQICTLPIILFIFGRLSLISVAANLLVVPLVPLAMLASLAAGIGGMISVIVGSLLGLPARVSLRYMLDISTLLSKIPHANVQFRISAAQMVYLYGLIIFLVVIMWTKHRRKTAV